ncbi:MAG: cation-transporting P-type ATPase [Polyangiaceae bacterium]|nr:cation-transporting P-type ATPase [Polyangiaceae bacterium]
MTVDDVLGHFRISPAEGLDDVRVEQFRAEFGRNILAGIESRSRIDILADQLFTFPCALLFGAAGLSLMLGDVIEAGAIVLVIGSNIVVGYFSESRAEELLHAWGELRAEWATVVRHGREVRIPAADVVPGDVLVVRAGDAIPADARIVEAHALSVDESMLTGESEPSEKTTIAGSSNAPLAERRAMLYAATIVAAGEGRAIVVATGQNTELGEIERALSRAEERAAPIERQLDILGKRVAMLAVASSVGIMGFGLLRGQPISVLLRSAVALGVAAIPEGFPAVGTTALALASHRLEREGIVIRRLAAAETLGAVSVVCADKTGTLTENRMRVQAVYLPSRGTLRIEWDRSSEANTHARLVDMDGKSVSPSELRDLTRITALNADVTFDESGQISTGSGTERALVEFAMALGYPVSGRRKTMKRLREQRRTPEKAFMLTVHDHPELGRIELIKGAPEQVIALSAGLSDGERRNALAQNDALASRALRVLAFGWRRVDDDANDAIGYSFVGLVGLEDPPRPGVREAMAILARAGITTRMLTGDQQKTALTTGRALGIPEDSIHSRVTPVEKLEVVEKLQAAGCLVAMTGDGVNDGPALKAADVGIAMGKRGTDIARAVADVVLAQDDLPSLVNAIAEGRRLHDNVRRAIHYLAATNTSEVMTMLLGATVGITPLGPLQLLWVNILTDIAPALALAVEPPEADLMQRPPRDPNAPLFTTNDLHNLVRHAALMAVGSLSSYGLGAAFGLGPGGARTMAFLSLVTSQILYTQTCSANSTQSDPALRWAVVGSFGLQAAALGIPGLRTILGIELVNPVALGTSLLIGAMPTWLTRPNCRVHTAPSNDSIITIVRREVSDPEIEEHCL